MASGSYVSVVFDYAVLEKLAVFRTIVEVELRDHFDRLVHCISPFHACGYAETSVAWQDVTCGARRVFIWLTWPLLLRLLLSIDPPPADSMIVIIIINIIPNFICSIIIQSTPRA